MEKEFVAVDLSIAFAASEAEFNRSLVRIFLLRLRFVTWAATGKYAGLDRLAPCASWLWVSGGDI